MKNIKAALVSFLVMGSCLITLKGLSQVNGTVPETTVNLEIPLLRGQTGTMIEAGAKNLDRINKRAIRQFVSWYKGIENEKWYSVSNGMIVRFQEKGLENMAAYNTKGRWLFTITYLNESQLPERIRDLIKSDYPDYAISTIEALENSSTSLYIVHMQNEYSWKNLRIFEEQMDVIQDFSKN
jgi:hypothetical protein